MAYIELNAHQSCQLQKLQKIFSHKEDVTLVLTFKWYDSQEYKKIKSLHCFWNRTRTSKDHLLAFYKKKKVCYLLLRDIKNRPCLKANTNKKIKTVSFPPIKWFVFKVKEMLMWAQYRENMTDACVEVLSRRNQSLTSLHVSWCKIL